MGREGVGRGGGAKVWIGDIKEYMHPDQPQTVVLVGGNGGSVRQEQLVRRHEGEKGGWVGGDSEYYEYNDQPRVCILYCPCFYLLFSLTIGYMNTGRPYFDKF